MAASAPLPNSVNQPGANPIYSGAQPGAQNQPQNLAPPPLGVPQARQAGSGALISTGQTTPTVPAQQGGTPSWQAQAQQPQQYNPQAQPSGQGYQGQSAVQDFINQSNSQKGPYDQQYQTLVNNSLRSAANLQASHDLAYGNLNSDYNLTQYLANQKLDTALRGNANNFAGAGTLHSSIYDQANQQSALANQNTLAQAAQRRAEQQAGLDMTLRSGDVGLLNQLATGQSDAAGRAAQAAYQQQLDAANAKYQQDQLALQQQANKQQQDYYNQMSGVNSQAQAQQSQYIQSLIGKLQPQTFDNPLTAGGYDPMSAIAGGIQGGTAYDPLNALYSKLQHTSW